MEESKLVFLLLVIVIIYLSLEFGTSHDRIMNYGLIAAIMGMIVLAYHAFSEHFNEHFNGNLTEHLINMDEQTELRNADNNVSDSELVESADRNLNIHGNISHDWDVDPLGQEPIKDLSFSISDKIDNSSTVNSVINNYSRMHRPQEAVSKDWYNVKDRQNYTTPFSLPENHLLYSGYSIQINDRAVNADDALARKQLHRGDINKKAIDGRVRATRDLYQKYFTDELIENEEREWWDGTEGMETDWRPVD